MSKVYKDTDYSVMPWSRVALEAMIREIANEVYDLRSADHDPTQVYPRVREAIDQALTSSPYEHATTKVVIK